MRYISRQDAEIIFKLAPFEEFMEAREQLMNYNHYSNDKPLDKAFALWNKIHHGIPVRYANVSLSRLDFATWLYTIVQQKGRYMQRARRYNNKTYVYNEFTQKIYVSDESGFIEIHTQILDNYKEILHIKNDFLYNQYTALQCVECRNAFNVYSFERLLDSVYSIAYGNGWLPEECYKDNEEPEDYGYEDDEE